MQDPTKHTPENSHRARLIEGFAAALAEKGFAATTIADIAERARVSKRTFYEHFDSKEECLLAAYEAATRAIRDAMVRALRGGEDLPWTEQLDLGLDAYLGSLEEMPLLARGALIEMAGAGGRARQVRREDRRAFARLLRDFADQARARHPEVKRLSETVAATIVAGLDELLLERVERGPDADLREVRDAAKELIAAVLGGDGSRGG